MAFPMDRDPYNVRVSAVTDGGSPVSGASIKLENLTKATDTTKVSSETNSNITINLSECGDWDVGDQIQVTTTYAGKTGSSAHTTASGDYGRYDFGSIAISTGGAAHGVQTANHTPSSPSGTGTAGQVVYDSSDIHVCIATDTWKRAAITTSGILAVAQGGTGVTGDTYDADKVDGCDAGNYINDVWKIGAEYGSAHDKCIFFRDVINGSTALAPPEVSGYQLTQNATGDPFWAAPYSHPSARQCTSGNWAWASITGIPAYATRWAAWTEVTSKPSTFTPSAHNQSAATITSGTLPVARGGTGVTGDTYDADKVDGCHAGLAIADVFKIHAASATGSLYTYWGGITTINPGTSGYQLTSNGVGNLLTWAAASDLIFSDTHCPKCGLEFQDGDNLVLHVIGHNEVGDILTIPMHQSCANDPKKTVMIKRKVMEGQYILDELTGELKVQRVQKIQEKTVTKHKLKDGCVLDNKTGKFWEMKDGKRDKKIGVNDALEEFEDTIDEIVYEDAEFEL